MPPRSAGKSPFLPIDQEILAGLVREEALRRENDALSSYFRCALDFFARRWTERLRRRRTAN